MPSQLADRLNSARRRRFVGRESERAIFQAALAAEELPFQVLYIYGPGGVGKTTLLKEFIAISEQSHIPAFYLDARDIDASPDGFLNAARLAMNLPEPASPAQALGARAGRQVLLVDTYEDLAPLDNWLRETFLPQLPESALVILAARNPPEPAWRTDVGWQSLVRTLPLRNLSPDESRVYLKQRAVPDEQHQSVLEFTHGHPLALSLVADTFAQHEDAIFQPQATPDVIKTLIERFVQKVPGPEHRAALEACALVRAMTETLLAHMLALPDAQSGNAQTAHVLFDWLRGLSFVESGPQGLFPHDLAREALMVDLRWRNPDWYAELHKRARVYYGARLQQTRGQEQQSVLIDYIFLHRDNPVVRPFFVQLQSQRREGPGVVTEVARESDIPALVEMVARHEGERSARLAAQWLARQLREVTVFRDADGRPAGFVMMLALHRAGADDLRSDPAAYAAWCYLQNYAPLRSGESATLFRFWMAADTYQSISPVQSLIFVNMVRHYLTTPGLAFTFLPCAEADFWQPVLSYADVPRIPAADFEVDGRRYGVYGHDWRATPPMAWLALLAEREVTDNTPDSLAPKVNAPLLALSREEFAQAVRDALHNVARASALRGNLLLRSRLVMDRAGANFGEPERIEALRNLIRSTIEGLRAAPRDAKLYRALYHTYLQPAATQEQAAEVLDLPFSTFRRHLQSGITRITDLLWRDEIGDVQA